MIRKEFRDILGPTLIKLSSLGLIPLFWLINTLFLGINFDYREAGVSVFGIVILWISFDYSSKMYKSETEDHAWEYLLCLPVPRTRILFAKLLPRVVCLGILIGIYLLSIELLFDRFTINQFDFLHPNFLIPISIAALLNGIIFGLLKIKDMPLLSILFIISTSGIAWALNLLGKSVFTGIFDEYPLYGNIIAGSLICSTIIYFRFIGFFKKFDSKPSDLHARLFTKLTLRPVLLMIFFCLLIIFLRKNNAL